MPIYEYDCGSCHKRVSVFLKSINAAEPDSCPECGAASLTKAISRVQFHKSAETKLAELDPKYEKMVDNAGADLSMDNLIKQYRLEESRSDEGKGVPDL
jgi:putative FmdB family regulatory protein